MSDITIEQAEQQLAEAKQREEEANKPWVLKPPTMGDMQTFKNLIDEVERKHSELEDTRQTLQDQWNDEVRTYNDAVSEFNSAQSSLADYINSNECIGNAEEYLTQEDEDNAVVVSDKLRQLLVNISEKADEFSTNDVEAEETDKYIEEADLSESHGVANDVHAQLETLQEYLENCTLTSEEKEAVERWGNNKSVWEVYDELKEQDKEVREKCLKYALSYYKPEGTGYAEMLKEMATEFGVDTEEGK
jgi:hypothetical protein